MALLPDKITIYTRYTPPLEIDMPGAGPPSPAVKFFKPYIETKIAGQPITLYGPFGKPESKFPLVVSIFAGSILLAAALVAKRLL